MISHTVAWLLENLSLLMSRREVRRTRAVFGCVEGTRRKWLDFESLQSQAAVPTTDMAAARTTESFIFDARSYR